MPHFMTIIGKNISTLQWQNLLFTVVLIKLGRAVSEFLIHERERSYLYAMIFSAILSTSSTRYAQYMALHFLFLSSFDARFLENYTIARKAFYFNSFG